MQMRRKMAHALQRELHKMRQSDVVREALADEPCYIILMFENIRWRDHPACAVPQNVDRKIRVLGSSLGYKPIDVAEIIRKVLDVKSFALRFAPAAKIESVRRQTLRRKLLGRPFHVAAV